MSEFACYQCGVDIDASSIDHELAEKPEMVVVCPDCARKVFIMLGLIGQEEQ